MTGEQLRTYTIQCFLSFIILGFAFGNLITTEFVFCPMSIGIFFTALTIVIGSRHVRFLDAIGEAMAKHSEAAIERRKSISLSSKE